MEAFKLSGVESVRNWPGLLKRLATIQALNQLRQRYRELDRTVELQANDVVDNASIEPMTALGASELADNLRAALSKIEPLQAEAFWLACVEDFTYQETAEKHVTSH